MVKIEIGKVMNLKRITKNNQPTKFPFVVTSEAGFGAGTPQQEHFKNAGASQKCSPGRAQHFQELRICGHGTILALTFLGKGVFMDIEIKRMSLLLLKCLTNSVLSANGSESIIMQPPKISVICWTALLCTNIN